MRTISRHLIKPFCLLLALSLIMLDLELKSARAGMIGTESILRAQANESPRALVAAFFERQEVTAALGEQGVSPEEARERVAAMSDAEIVQVARVIEQLPAGGDSIIGAAVFVFLVLLVTDILGYTKIFPFVQPVR
jgi:hypothetical protein